MSGSEKICNNVTYLAKKRKAITEMNALKNKLLEQQCMSIGEVTRQYLIEKGLYGNPVQSKTYWLMQFKELEKIDHGLQLF